MKPNKGLFINSQTGFVSEVSINDYTDINNILGCSTFTCVRLSPTEVLYVDDEGLINGTTFGFLVGTGHGQLMGNGLVLGVHQHSGESVDTKIGFADLAGLGMTGCFNLVSGEAQSLKSIHTLN